MRPVIRLACLDLQGLRMVRSAEERQHAGLFWAQLGRRRSALWLARLWDARRESAVRVGIQHTRMDLAAAADGRRVAEPRGGASKAGRARRAAALALPSP